LANQVQKHVYFKIFMS